MSFFLLDFPFSRRFSVRFSISNCALLFVFMQVDFHFFFLVEFTYLILVVFFISSFFRPIFLSVITAATFFASVFLEMFFFTFFFLKKKFNVDSKFDVFADPQPKMFQRTTTTKRNVLPNLAENSIQIFVCCSMCSNITCACLKWLYVYLFFAFFCNCSWFLFFLSFDSVLCELFLQFRISNQIRFFWSNFAIRLKSFFFIPSIYVWYI